MKSRPQTVKYPQVMDEKQNRQESRSINLGSVPGLPNVPVRLAEVNILTAITARGHMIEAARQFDS